ncbi:hypothetical protein FOPE_01259 [Fonsecaea pedrosoi]|nr:hypothetical protein FOPE_01259 [Fonsecaea pedrosoi]
MRDARWVRREEAPDITGGKRIEKGGMAMKRSGAGGNATSKRLDVGLGDGWQPVGRMKGIVREKGDGNGNGEYLSRLDWERRAY